MKRIFNILLLIALCAGFESCKEEYVTYSEGEHLIFADTLTTNAVMADGKPFKVSISSTVARKYDRTYAVEIIDNGSNAIEGYHYRLKSNTITIPAGELATDVEVYGVYDNIEPTDSLGFTLQLVMPEELKWDLYPKHNRTKVTMFKSCPFDINEWGGTKEGSVDKPKYCLLTSLLLYSYPGTNTSYSRLVKCYKHKSMENTIIMEGLFYDGYDVRLKFNTENPSQPTLELEADQVIGDEFMVFGIAHGDGKILAQTSPATNSSASIFNSCQKFAQLWTRVYVKDFSMLIGYVGDFYNILEWVSDEEAEEMLRDGV